LNNDLKRMEQFYSSRENNAWSLFKCYPFFLASKQLYVLTKILDEKKLHRQKILDIGAGSGSFILNLILLGASAENISAVEYLEDRFIQLKTRLPNIHALNQNYLDVNFQFKFDLITIMAVLTSITDNTSRYQIVSKALEELEENGMLIIYDFFDEKETFLSKNYRAISMKKIKELANNYKIVEYKKVYLHSKIAKGLCKLNLQEFIPILEKLKLFNANYHFVIISK